MCESVGTVSTEGWCCNNSRLMDAWNQYASIHNRRVFLVHRGECWGRKHLRGAFALSCRPSFEIFVVHWNVLQGPETNMDKVADLCAISEKGHAASMVVTNHNKKVSYEASSSNGLDHFETGYQVLY